MSNAKIREIVRRTAQSAQLAAESVRKDMGLAEAGALNDAITCLAETIATLATALERLVDVSEAQDAELDELREQIGNA